MGVAYIHIDEVYDVAISNPIDEISDGTAEDCRECDKVNHVFVFESNHKEENDAAGENGNQNKEDMSELGVGVPEESPCGSRVFSIGKSQVGVDHVDGPNG